MRVAIYSHGHPQLHAGGTEVASYNLFMGLSAVEAADPIYVAHCGDASIDPGSGGLHQIDRGAQEFIFFASDVDPVFFHNTELKFIDRELVPFLEQRRIQVLHCHHFLGLGLNGLMLLKRRLPQLKIVMTLHEYLAICLHHGQMVTRPEMSLCQTPNAFTCSRCYPELGPRRFVLREELFKRAFSSIDAFICPSHFAMSRFLDWGIPGDITVLENGHRREVPHAATPVGEVKSRLRLGFFGSFTPFKGVDVVLEAARILYEERVDAEIAVYGILANLDSDTLKKFHNAVHELGPVLRYYGPYAMNSITSLMAQCDWVLVPSIWWENSPVVLEEALQAGCPILASDVGGMREKISEGRDGLGFRVGDPYDLAQKIQILASDRSITERYRSRLRTVKSFQEAAIEHYQFYTGIVS